MIVLINYGSGNTESLRNALEFLGTEIKITSNPKDLAQADRIILPGVGAFGYLMREMGKKRLIQPLRQEIASGKPFMGICLGMQALFEESEESPGVKGLGVLKGRVVKFQNQKVPQIGWNNVCPARKGIEDGYAYFVNSYYARPQDPLIVAATSEYGVQFPSIIAWQNITATQFHPEKSGKYGLQFLRKWLC